MLRKSIILLIAGGLSLLLTAVAFGEVVPTSVWCNFRGSASSYNGNSLPVGSIIDVYDTEAVHCGTFVVSTEGQYGFMAVYGDDGYGEGPTSGEALTFYVNGMMAIPMGPDQPLMGTFGSSFEVNLSASASVSMEPVSAIDSYDAYPGETVTVSMMIRNTGEGIDFYTVGGTTQHGWLTNSMFGFVYALPGQAVTVEFEVLIPYAIFNDMTELVDFRVQSGVDANVYVDRQAEINVFKPLDVGDDDELLLPGEFKLEQNYPNPFNPSTRIDYSLPARADVNVEIYDLLGRLIRSTDLGSMEAGEHTYEFNGADLASGVYFYRVSANEFSETRKMILLK
ncbi:MAG: T9SS type A sorting domain-containing protein [Candidatus Zixiibacteriota bacterium]